eukprot:scaffold417_cov252-Pinguiococcus_pyrenoidosus.AAC.35
MAPAPGMGGATPGILWRSSQSLLLARCTCLWRSRARVHVQSWLHVRRQRRHGSQHVGHRRREELLAVHAVVHLRRRRRRRRKGIQRARAVRRARRHERVHGAVRRVGPQAGLHAGAWSGVRRRSGVRGCGARVGSLGVVEPGFAQSPDQTNLFPLLWYADSSQWASCFIRPLRRSAAAPEDQSGGGQKGLRPIGELELI